MSSNGQDEVLSALDKMIYPLMLEGLRRTRLSQKVFLMVTREMLMTLMKKKTQTMKMMVMMMRKLYLKN